MECKPYRPSDAKGVGNPAPPLRRSQAALLFALDVGSGGMKWTYRPRHLILRDSIAIGKGRVFFIDKPVPDAGMGGKKAQGSAGELVSLDAGSGKVLWKKSGNIFGSMLALSEKHDALLMAHAGQPMRYLKSDRGKGMVVFRASTGDTLWEEQVAYSIRPVVVDRVVITQIGNSRTKDFSPCAWDLLSGEPKARANPVSGRGEAWIFGNLIRCGLFSASNNVLLYRAWRTCCVDLRSDQGFTIIPGFRVGCWLNILPVGGIVLLPDNVPNCFCNFMHRTGIALAPVDRKEHWAWFNGKAPAPGIIKHFGINCGAPGDRRDRNGTLWLAMPRPYGRGDRHSYRRLFDPGGAVTVGKTAVYRTSADRVSVADTDVPWVVSSGFRGPSRIGVNVGKMPAGTKYKVRLLFAELEDTKPGERVFDVTVAGRPVLTNFDIVREAGRKNAAVVKEFTVGAAGRLEIKLVPRRGEPVLSGVEIEALGK